MASASDPELPRRRPGNAGRGPAGRQGRSESHAQSNEEKMHCLLAITFLHFCSMVDVTPSNILFQGLKFFLQPQGIGPMRFQILRRSITAHGGTFANTPSVDVNVLVADDVLNKADEPVKLRDVFEMCSPQSILVSTRWIADCVEKSTLLDSRPYQIFSVACPRSQTSKDLAAPEDVKDVNDPVRFCLRYAGTCWVIIRIAAASETPKDDGRRFAQSATCGAGTG